MSSKLQCILLMERGSWTNTCFQTSGPNSKYKRDRLRVSPLGIEKKKLVDFTHVFAQVKSSDVYHTRLVTYEFTMLIHILWNFYSCKEMNLQYSFKNPLHVNFNDLWYPLMSRDESTAELLHICSGKIYCIWTFPYVGKITKTSLPPPPESLRSVYDLSHPNSGGKRDPSSLKQVNTYCLRCSQ